MIAPPSTFSIRPTDPNFYPAWKALGPTFDVMLDGEPVTRVIAYDQTDGWVRRLKTNATGGIMLNEARDGARPTKGPTRPDRQGGIEKSGRQGSGHRAVGFFSPPQVSGPFFPALQCEA